MKIPGLDCKNVPSVLDLPSPEQVSNLTLVWPQDVIFNQRGFPDKITNLILIEINKQETGKKLFAL